MTMMDKRCDVCHEREPVGVASTAMPLSVAYCGQCAKRNAQPECVFLCWEEDIPPKHHRCPDAMVTFKDGKYISYRKWFNDRHPKQGSRSIPVKTQEGSVSGRPAPPKRD